MGSLKIKKRKPSKLRLKRKYDRGKIIKIDFDQMHRLETPNEDKSRSIIIKFASQNAKSRVFRNKKKLKGKKMSV